MTLQTGQQIAIALTLNNISRSKGNQTMKFCQFIEYYMQSIFLKNITQNVMEKLIPYHFMKIRN